MDSNKIMSPDNIAETLDALLCESGESCRYVSRMHDLEQQLELLSSQVRTDALTGLYNFRFLSETLPLEMERARRSLQPLSLILLDVDHFKAFNDRWGHELGNQALVHLAQLLGQALRKLDFACRFGGEEFAIILPNTDLTQALAVAERLREQLEKTPLVLTDGSTIPLTASLGLDIYLGELNESPQDFLGRVDAWLYQAKKAGRNCCAHPDIAPPVESDTQVTHEERDILFSLFDQNQTEP